MIQGLPRLPLSPEKSPKTYSPQSDSKSIMPGRIKDRQAFLCLSRAVPAVFTDTFTLFHTWQQPLPLEDMTKKERKPGQWQKKRYETSLTNSAVRSPRSQQDSSISLSTHWHFNYALRTSRAPGRGKSSHDWRQTARMLCLPKSVRSSESMDEGKWGLQAKCRVQSTEQKTKAWSRYKHCHRRAKLLYFFMLGMQGDCWDGSCPVLLLSLPSQLRTDA